MSKTIIAAVIAGIIGGGASYGGISYLHNNNLAQESAVPSGSNRGGTAKVNNVKVNVQNQSERAFNSVRSDVVSVINQKRGGSSQDPLARLFGKKSSGKGSLQTSSEGSGVIYKLHNGSAYIVTNNHVVSGSNALQIILSNGSKLKGKLVGTDKTNDLAVIKINGSQVRHAATFGNSDRIKVGETSLAIGSPLGSSYASTLTQGIISAKKRKVNRVSNGQSLGKSTVIQTDAAINPGNSGGPLINLGGQVVGINEMKVSSDNQGTSVEGMGFAIPSNEVTRIINKIVKK